MENLLPYRHLDPTAMSGRLKAVGSGSHTHATSATNVRTNATFPMARPNPKKWYAHLVHHADKSVTGEVSVHVANQHLLNHGRVDGRAEQGRFWGRVFDDDGNQAATFTVGYGANGIEGTYVTSEGDSGSFTWDGDLTLPPPGAQ
ncbi:MAG: hypothetical protein HY270_12270 [Deltaproteobacteria bacterium]|nr:hypothetical protein [Deltaproteobacteria bacterium]